MQAYFLYLYIYSSAYHFIKLLFKNMIKLKKQSEKKIPVIFRE